MNYMAGSREFGLREEQGGKKEEKEEECVSWSWKKKMYQTPTLAYILSTGSIFPWGLQNECTKVQVLPPMLNTFPKQKLSLVTIFLDCWQGVLTVLISQEQWWKEGYKIIGPQDGRDLKGCLISSLSCYMGVEQGSERGNNFLSRTHRTLKTQ